MPWKGTHKSRLRNGKWNQTTSIYEMIQHYPVYSGCIYTSTHNNTVHWMTLVYILLCDRYYDTDREKIEKQFKFLFDGRSQSCVYIIINEWRPIRTLVCKRALFFLCSGRLMWDRKTRWPVPRRQQYVVQSYKRKLNDVPLYVRNDMTPFLCVFP